MSAPTIVTLGCRLNLAESETIRGFAHAPDTVVVNSCAVTRQAVKATRQAIRRAGAGKRVVVTGCAADLDPHSFAAIPEVAQVIGNAAKLDPAAWASAARVVMPEYGAGFAPIAVATDRARAFVSVQTGCDHRCTFCTIPLARGPSRSVPIDTVIEHIAAAVDAGRQEVVLTGVDLTSYGTDLPGVCALGTLVEAILARVPRLPRLRLSSLDSVEIDDRLFALLTQEPRLMPHVHLSLQAGNDLVLKRMKRRHSRRDAVALVARLKAARPEIAIGADLIAGFPTESEAMAADTLALLDDGDIVLAHIFPYSERAETPAARMPQVPPELRRARAERLRTRADERKAAWLAGLVGRTQPVLVERPGDRGHAPGFAEVRLAAPAAVGSIVQARITHTDAHHLFGTPA